jgi:hypothetical protein
MERSGGYSGGELKPSFAMKQMLLFASAGMIGMHRDDV